MSLAPHGEHLSELACVGAQECMQFARKTCQGDFEVVPGGGVPSGGGLMLVHATQAREAGGARASDAPSSP